MKIVLGCIVEGLSTRNDGSVKISLATQELDAALGGNLLQLRNKFVKVLISDSNISPLEEKLIDEEPLAGGKKAKTPGQRLRNIMFVLHREQGMQIDFEIFYKQEMEKLIDQYKDSLND